MDVEPPKNRSNLDKFRVFIRERVLGVQRDSLDELVKSMELSTTSLQILLCNINKLSRVS